MLYQHPGGLVLTKRVVDYCEFIPGAKVIDIGCGTGMTVEFLRDIYLLQAVGIDLSKERLEQGRQRSPRLPLVQATAKGLPFADSSFEGGIAECSLSVMQEQEKVLAECSRVLVPGGKLAITDVYWPDSDSSAGYMNSNQLKKMLEEAGFAIVVWEDQSTFLREFVACYIMEHGSMEELWQCVSIPKTKLGYFLLVAEKRQRKG